MPMRRSFRGLLKSTIAYGAEMTDLAWINVIKNYDAKLVPDDVYEAIEDWDK